MILIRPTAWRKYMALALIASLMAGAAYCLRLGYPCGQTFTIVPATAAPDARARGTVALLLSGDMGFNIGMGPRIARQLAAQGISVLAVNSLSAFSRRQTQGDAQAFMVAAIRRALALRGAKRVMLIGHSFGGNMALAGLRDLPAGLRAQLSGIAMIVPADTMLYRASPDSILAFGRNDGPAMPFARSLNWAPVLCVYGVQEKHSLCPLWHAANVHVAALPGAHSLNHDAPLVAATVLRALIDHDADRG